MAGLAYGTALAVACSIRATNLALLPAVAIYWVALAEPRGLVDAMQSVRKPFVITAALMFVLVYVLLMYLGGWTGNASRAPLQLQYLANNMSFYYVAEFGFAAIVVILPLTAVGLFEVWHRSRPLFLVSLYMLLLWPLPHALVPFANGRYVLPAAVFVFACAAHAPAGLSRLWKERPLVLATARTLVCASMIALASMYISIDGHMLFTWQDAS